MREIVDDAVWIVEPDKLNPEPFHAVNRLIDDHLAFPRKPVNRLDIRHHVLHATTAGIGRQVAVKTAQCDQRRTMFETVGLGIEQGVVHRWQGIKTNEVLVERATAFEIRHRQANFHPAIEILALAWRNGQLHPLSIRILQQGHRLATVAQRLESGHRLITAAKALFQRRLIGEKEAQQTQASGVLRPARHVAAPLLTGGQLEFGGTKTQARHFRAAHIVGLQLGEPEQVAVKPEHAFRGYGMATKHIHARHREQGAQCLILRTVDLGILALRTAGKRHRQQTQRGRTGHALYQCPSVHAAAHACLPLSLVWVVFIIPA